MSNVTKITLGISNVILIRDKGRILVDTGTNMSREKYLELFSQLKISPEEIQLIVISHGHSDHFAHVHELKELTGAPVLCHRNAVHALQTGRNPEIIPRNELGRRVMKLIRGHEPVVVKTLEPDLIVDTIFDLNPYGVAGKIIHTPGHSDCSITVMLDSGEAIVGDMLVPSFFTGEPCVAYFANNEQALFASVRCLLEHTHTFYGGHGGPFTKEEVLKIAEFAETDFCNG